MTFKATRTALYAILLVLAILETAAGIMAALMFRPLANEYVGPQVYTGSFGGFFATLTFVWSIVLLCYNDRPFSEHRLTLTRVHLYSVIGMAVVWLVMAALFSRQLPFECGPNYDSSVWSSREASCGSGAAAMTFAWLLFIVASIGSYILWNASKDAKGAENVTFKDEIDPLRKPPQKKTAGPRTTLYCLTIIFGLAQTGLGVFIAVLSGFTYGDYDPFPVEVAYAPLATFFALWSWIWASVLLSYNNRPKSHAPLTTLRAHLISAVVLAIIWLVLAILFATRLPHHCGIQRPSDGRAGTWCGADATASGISWTLFFLNVAIALSTGLAAKRRGGLDHNVAT